MYSWRPSTGAAEAAGPLTSAPTTLPWASVRENPQGRAPAATALSTSAAITSRTCPSWPGCVKVATRIGSSVARSGVRRISASTSPVGRAPVSRPARKCRRARTSTPGRRTSTSIRWTPPSLSPASGSKPSR